MNDYYKDKRVMVTGGAGFIGSHLVDRLVEFGSKVTVVDNLITGSRDNLSGVLESIEFIEADVSVPAEEYLGDRVFDCVFHLASPASPKDFESIPVKIYRVNAWGTHYLCEHVKETGARLLYASTSEAYGDPLEHPQREDYFGNVNPIGPRACYDESKRFGEMVVSTFIRSQNVDARTVRIFNTYGPRMQSEDGRVIPNFINQSLSGEALTIHGDGSQTRSFCYVDQLVEYLLRAMRVGEVRGEVINIGNPDEYTIKQMADVITRLTGGPAEYIYKPLPQDDPMRRKPDVSKAVSLLGKLEYTSLEEGLMKTIEYFRER